MELEKQLVHGKLHVTGLYIYYREGKEGEREKIDGNQSAHSS